MIQRSLNFGVTVMNNIKYEQRAHNQRTITTRYFLTQYIVYYLFVCVLKQGNNIVAIKQYKV